MTFGQEIFIMLQTLTSFTGDWQISLPLVAQNDALSLIDCVSFK
jgi:hypothetical protein